MVDENINKKKIVKLEELLPFTEEELLPLTDDPFFQINKQYLDELVEILPVKNHEHGYWICVRPDPNDTASGKYEVASGHEIVWAAEKAGLDSVTAIIMPSQEELDSDILKNSEDEETSIDAFKNLRRIKQADDVVMIELDQLVPFDNCSYEMFRGVRFEEMVNNVRVLGVVRPIIVRPTIDGKYEILNGHYRFAAAIKLELNVVPAVVHEGLTDEEALLFVSETSPIGLLTKYDVDIDTFDFKESSSFKNMHNDRIFPDDGFSMALDEYIERYLLTKNEVSNIYESKYDMGNPYELDDYECRFHELARDINIRMTEPEVHDQIREWEKSKNPNDKEAARAALRSIEDKSPELVNTFTQRGGYIDQLKIYLNLDFDTFNNNDIKNKCEKAKILYFLYMLKNRHFPKVNILEMLSKPSMENIDNSFLGRETSNGRFIKVIKHSLEKELTLQAKDDIKGALSHIADTWSGFINYTLINIDHLIRHGYDFDGIISLLRSEPKKLSEHERKSETKKLYS